MLATKWIALAVLSVQNSSVALLMRYSRANPLHREYQSSSVVGAVG
jgi:hypothetical protein